MSQLYTKSESKRIFGFINTGASAGAICGPLLVVSLAQRMSVENILLVTSGALLLTLPLIRLLNVYFDRDETKDETLQRLSPNPFSGFQELLSHKRLLGIAAFIFMFTSISAFLYSTQKNVLAELPEMKRTYWLGMVELITNGLTIIIGIFLTNRLSRRFGMPVTLSIVPFFVALLILVLSVNPVVLYVLALQVVRRAGNYAITRPAREILFTAVDREARYKTKPIIDVAVYRGGDVFWIWIIAMLGDGYLNMSISSILYVGTGIAILWGLVGIYIGKKHEADEKAELAG